jgi:hypothetical protein
MLCVELGRTDHSDPMLLVWRLREIVAVVRSTRASGYGGRLARSRTTSPTTVAPMTGLRRTELQPASSA